MWENVKKNCQITLSADIFTTKQNLKKHSTVHVTRENSNFCLPPWDVLSMSSMKIRWQKGQAPYFRLSYPARTYRVSMSSELNSSESSSSLVEVTTLKLPLLLLFSSCTAFVMMRFFTLTKLTHFQASGNSCLALLVRRQTKAKAAQVDFPAVELLPGQSSEIEEAAL